MKVSLNWVKQFTDVDLTIDELVEKIGRQLGAVEGVEAIGKKYEGAVIVRVASCEKHPNADSLSLCLIDDGGRVGGVERNDDGLVQVVCGAPNVREGLRAVWLPPGSTVPASADKEPFVLSAREIRGTVSNGMMASASELAISDDHNGIVEVDLDVAPGTSFVDAYELNDYIIDIENKMFTHRPDCFGILGIAREVAGISGKPFTSPDWYMESLGRVIPGDQMLPFTVRNELPELVPRFIMVAMTNVTVRPSPLLLQTYLMRVGVRPINNVVDITNYLMMLTGQPLHAFDYDKLKVVAGSDAPEIVLRHPKKGEKISLLNGKVLEPRAGAIMVATDRGPLAIAGVMGGAETEVDESTHNILIECATFDMYSIRRTSMENGLFTDAVTRFNKGQSHRQNDRVVEEAVTMVEAFAAGTVASDVVDNYPGAAQQTATEVTAGFINDRLGSVLSAEEIAVLLGNVEFSVTQTGDDLSVTPPFWRTDIEIAEDVVEEVGRLLGYENLPVVLPIRDMSPAPLNPLLETKRKIREALKTAGANEVLTYTFVHGDLLEKVGQDKSEAFQLGKAISPDLQYYRLSVLPSLLERIHANIKSGHEAFALYELNQVHARTFVDEETGLPLEDYRVALTIAADDKNAENAFGSGAAYFAAKRFADALLNHFHIEARYESATKHNPSAAISKAAIAPFDVSRSATIWSLDGTFIGEIGELRTSVRRQLKLPSFVAGFELDVMALMKLSRPISYVPLSRYPKVEQDISLRVPVAVPYGEVASSLRTQLDTIAPDNVVTSLQPLDIYQKQDDAEYKQVTFRYSITSYDQTLKAEAVNSLLDKAATALQSVMGAERI